MELFKQEMELFLPLAGLWSKNFFYKNFLISTKEFKIDFQNRKRNYLNKMELFIPLPALWSKNFLYKMFHIFTKEFVIDFQNRKWNYFSHFQSSDQKTSLTKMFSFSPRSSKLIFKTGNEIIKTGNGIISPTSRLLIKKLLLQHFLHFNQGVNNWFSKQEVESSKQEMELFIPLPALWSKNFFNKNFLISTQEFKIDFRNRNRNYLNRKRNYLSHFSLLKKRLLQDVHFFPKQGVWDWYSK